MEAIYINIILTAAAILGYILIYKVQKRALDSMKTTIESQSSIISNLKDLKEIFDLDELKKWYSLKIDNEKTELTRELERNHEEIRSEIVKIVGKLMRDSFKKIYEEQLNKWIELRDKELILILSSFEKMSDKPLRDEHIKKNYPLNYQDLIDRADYLFDSLIQNGEKPEFG